MISQSRASACVETGSVDRVDESPTARGDFVKCGARTGEPTGRPNLKGKHDQCGAKWHRPENRETEEQPLSEGETHE